MQITFAGETGFILKGETVGVSLACDPQQTGDERVVITRTADDAVKAKKEQAVMDWPGEYESAGVAVFIIPVGKDQSGRVVKVMLDDVALCHLTDVREPLTDKEEEKIGNIDILFAPAKKDGALPGEKVQQLVESIDPRLLVPMVGTEVDALELGKKLGFGELTAENQLKISKSSLPSDRMEMRLLSTK